MLRRGSLGHGEQLSTIVRIHRVIHYICNCVIVSGHFTQRRKASEAARKRLLGCCCVEKADSQGLSEPAHPCYQKVSLHFQFLFPPKMESLCCCCCSAVVSAHSIATNLSVSAYELHDVFFNMHVYGRNKYFCAIFSFLSGKYICFVTFPPLCVSSFHRNLPVISGPRLEKLSDSSGGGRDSP